MNPFTAHPRTQGITYTDHGRFAAGIAYRLLTSAAAFALHAVLPFISIAPRLDLEATAGYLMERNRWIEGARDTSAPRQRPGVAVYGHNDEFLLTQSQ